MVLRKLNTNKQSKQLRLTRKFLMLGLISLSVQGCSQNILSNFCDIYKPVFFNADTQQELIDDITDNNIAYEELNCDK